MYFFLPQIHLERARDELTLQNFTLKSRLSQVANNISDPAVTYQINKDGGKLSVKDAIKTVENLKISDIGGKETSVDDPDVVRILRKSTYKVTEETQRMRELVREFEAKELEYKKRIEGLEVECLNLQNASSDRYNRSVRELEGMLERGQQKAEATDKFMEEKEEELNMLKLDVDTLTEENARLKQSLTDIMAQKQVTNKAFLWNTIETVYIRRIWYNVIYFI